MKTESEIANYISLLCAIHPNDADLGAQIRKHYLNVLEDKETPERTCDIDDEDCINCGS
jgi:hypothetical protein